MRIKPDFNWPRFEASVDDEDKPARAIRAISRFILQLRQIFSERDKELAKAINSADVEVVDSVPTEEPEYGAPALRLYKDGASWVLYAYPNTEDGWTQVAGGGGTVPDWGDWAATQKSAADWTDDELAASAEETSDAISNDNVIATEISIKVVYHASATDGVTVYVLRDTDGTNYETSSDGPRAFGMPFSAGGTYYKALTVYGDEVSGFKVSVKNGDGSYSATVTVKQRQAA